MLNQQIRQAMIEQRKKLPKSIIAEYSTLITEQLNHLSEFQHSQNVGLYWPIAGEVDTQPIITLCLKLGKRCYLPKIIPNFQLDFCLYNKTTTLIQNQFGITEPDSNECIAATALDVVFVPTVAFDTKGHRLGFGAGYYDRCFSFHKINSKIKPVLLGLAYQFQLVNNLPQNPWDVPLDIILTEQGLTYFA